MVFYKQWCKQAVNFIYQLTFPKTEIEQIVNSPIWMNPILEVLNCVV